MLFTLFSKYLENRSNIVRFNLQFYYLLTSEKWLFTLFWKYSEIAVKGFVTIYSYANY